jgi:hypothetical protein
VLKIVIVLMLVGVVASLFSGLYYLNRDRGQGSRTVKALTLRIGLSIAVFVILLLSYRFGLIPGYSQ